jgi:hypothetical protein
LQLPGKGLPGHVDANSQVITTNRTTTGTILKAGKQGDKSISILYQNSTSLGSCFVGGNPEPIIDGCKSKHKNDNNATPLTKRRK